MNDTTLRLPEARQSWERAVQEHGADSPQADEAFAALDASMQATIDAET